MHSVLARTRRRERQSVTSADDACVDAAEESVARVEGRLSPRPIHISYGSPDESSSGSDSSPSESPAPNNPENTSANEGAVEVFDDDDDHDDDENKPEVEESLSEAAAERQPVRVSWGKDEVVVADNSNEPKTDKNRGETPSASAAAQKSDHTKRRTKSESEGKDHKAKPQIVSVARKAASVLRIRSKQTSSTSTSSSTKEPAPPINDSVDHSAPTPMMKEEIRPVPAIQEDRIRFGLSKTGITRTVVLFGEKPRPHPLVLCFSFPSHALTHQLVLKLVRGVIGKDKIPGAEIMSLQYIDRNVVHGARGLENRWIITLNKPEAFRYCVRTGFVLFNKIVRIWSYDEVLNAEYEQFLKYKHQLKYFNMTYRKENEPVII